MHFSFKQDGMLQVSGYKRPEAVSYRMACENAVSRVVLGQQQLVVNTQIVVVGYSGV